MIDHPTKDSTGAALDKIRHEIRTPIHVIGGLSDMLSSSPAMTDQERKMLQMLKENTGKLLVLVEKALELVQDTVQTHPCASLQQPEPVLSGEQPLTSQDAKRRILVVEDHPPNVQVLSALLQQLGCDYDVAENGLQALDMFSAHHYGLILMDIQMGGMDGLETAARIRALERKRNIVSTPIVATTANATEDDHLICRRSGMNGCLSKPFGLEDLRDILETFKTN